MGSFETPQKNYFKFHSASPREISNSGGVEPNSKFHSTQNDVHAINLIAESDLVHAESDLFHNTESDSCSSSVVPLHILEKTAERRNIDLLIDPVLLGGGPVAEFFRFEPEGDLMIGRLNSVGAVADVAPNLLQTCFN